MSLGARIRAARERRGLTLAQLGDLLDLHRQAVHRYEQDGAEPGASMLRAIAVALDVSADELLGLRVTRQTSPRAVPPR